MDKVYLLDTFVAGRQFYDADDAWHSLAPGSALQLRGEPANEADRFAVELWLSTEQRDYKIGYLPRTCNETIATMIAMGWGDAFECVVSRLDASAPYERQIGITLKVLRRENSHPTDSLEKN